LCKSGGLDSRRGAQHRHREAPEGGSAQGVFQEDRQASDDALSALHQLERARHGKPAGVAGKARLDLLLRVFEQIQADHRLVRLQGEDLADDALGCQIDGPDVLVEGQERARRRLESLDASVALMDQCRQGIGHRKGAIDLDLENVGEVVGDRRRIRPRELQALLLGEGDRRAGKDGCRQEDRGRDHPGSGSGLQG
jgi:hypothetical protein